MIITIIIIMTNTSILIMIIKMFITITLLIVIVLIIASPLDRIASRRAALRYVMPHCIMAIVNNVYTSRFVRVIMAQGPC